MKTVRQKFEEFVRKTLLVDLKYMDMLFPYVAGETDEDGEEIMFTFFRGEPLGYSNYQIPKEDTDKFITWFQEGTKWSC